MKAIQYRKEKLRHDNYQFIGRSSIVDNMIRGIFYESKTALDRGKDQPYMLACLSQRQLAHTVLPLGGYTKPEVRELAARFGLTGQQGKRIPRTSALSRTAIIWGI